MSRDIKAIQTDLVNAGSDRTHRIKREKYPRFSQIFWDAPPNPTNPRHWVYGQFRGWVIGDDCETVSEGGYGGGEFISVTIYLLVGDRYSAQVEEGWFNPMEYECDSVFHASPVPCETPGQLHEWLSDGWKHSTAVTGAWEKACRTYPPMCGA